MAETPRGRLDDRVEELPLLTESATVTRVDALDRRRGEEVRRAVRRLLGEHDVETESFVDEEAVAWDALENALADAAVPAVTERKLATLRERDERAYPSLVSLAFDPETAFDFAPGQFVTIRYAGTPRPYSIASSPNADELELCIRRVPGGRLTDTLCSAVTPGDSLPELRGPNGEFTLQDPSTNDMAFLATGTGVAPLRSMIRYVYEEGLDTHRGEPRDVWLFVGASWEDDLAYREEFRELDAEREHFHFVPTLSRERVLTDWDGETAYVQRTFLKYIADDIEAPDLDAAVRDALDADPATDIEARIDPSALEVYACGVSAMVETLERVCEGVGVEGGDIRSEGYG